MKACLLPFFGVAVMAFVGVGLSKSPPEAALEHTQTRTLRSEWTGEAYELMVWLPWGYDASEQRYPVVYLLDANVAFGIAANMADLLAFAGELPELIIVGVGYHDNASFLEGRTRDYTPTPESGSGADAFLGFLKSELIPFVDATYRTAPEDRTLWGYSLTGQFVLYALLEEPGLFQRYVAGSPELSGEVVFDLEAAFREAHDTLPVNLVLTVNADEGGFIPTYRVEEFQKALSAGNYQGLALTTHEFEGETHVSGTARAVTWGLKAAFANPPGDPPQE